MGAPRCVYHVRWDTERESADGSPEQIAALQHQLDAMKERLHSVFAAASDLIAADDLDDVLARITARAALEVRAIRYLLAVKVGPAGELHCHHKGFEEEGVAEYVDELLHRAARDSSGLVAGRAGPLEPARVRPAAGAPRHRPELPGAGARAVRGVRALRRDRAGRRVGADGGQAALGAVERAAVAGACAGGRGHERRGRHPAVRRRAARGRLRSRRRVPVGRRPRRARAPRRDHPRRGRGRRGGRVGPDPRHPAAPHGHRGIRRAAVRRRDDRRPAAARDAHPPRAGGDDPGAAGQRRLVPRGADRVGVRPSRAPQADSRPARPPVRRRRPGHDRAPERPPARRDDPPGDARPAHRARQPAAVHRPAPRRDRAARARRSIP